MAKRDRAFRKYKRDRTDTNWSDYKKVRNLCNKLVRNSKKRYIAEQISLSTRDGLWKFLRSLGLGKPKSNDSNINFDLNILNAHFSSTSELNSLAKSKALSHIISLPFPTCDHFEFHSVSQDRVLQIINNLKTKAVGCDDVGRVMLMHIINYALPTITHIVNHSFISCEFPDLWRKAHIIPLPKIPNPTLPNQFRPISILPFLSKVIEAEAHRQLSQFLTSEDLLNPLQSGFRVGHSTTTALLKVTEDIRTGMEHKLVTILVLVDFSSAFNAVDHELLLTLLPRLNFSSSTTKWFASYLLGRQQAVRSSRGISDWHDVEAGVPQGGILSPLLFSLFINLLTPNIKSNYHMYADDLQLYTACSTDDLIGAVAELNSDLLRLQSWSECYGIKVNPDKCQAIIIGSSRQIAKIDQSSLPSLFYNNVVIPFSSSVKNLGVMFDCTLSWSDHTKEISRKFFSSMHSIIRLKNFLPTKTKISLVNTLLLPIIDYADVCFVDLNANLLNKLDRLLNMCIRFVFGLRKFDHISEHRAKLKWLPIRERRNIKILTTLYSILNDPNTPRYLKERFEYLSDTHERQLRSTANLLLSTPQHSSSFLNKSFTVTAISLWNNLPLDIKSATSKLVFKRKLHKLYLKESLTPISS